MDEFEAGLDATRPPGGLCPALEALWWARRGDWDAAHVLVQDDPGSDAAWVHAWLHRVEGDPGNAAYWYRRAKRPIGTGSTGDEWRALASALLRDTTSRDRRPTS